MIEPEYGSYFFDKTKKFSKINLADLRKYVLKKESQKKLDSNGKEQAVVISQSMLTEAENIRSCSVISGTETASESAKIASKTPAACSSAKSAQAKVKPAGSKRPFSGGDCNEFAGKSAKRLKTINDHFLAKDKGDTSAKIAQNDSRKRKFCCVDKSENEKDCNCIGKGNSKKAKVAYS